MVPLDLNLLEPVRDSSTFTKNQDWLLAHQTAELFFARVVALAREHGWASDAHFTVDGTQIDAWASLKSFQPKTGGKDPTDGDPGDPGVDFHGQQRRNATHASTTDAEGSSPARAGGKEARLCFGLHALRENRHGLCVQARVSTAHGVTESAAATELLGRQIDLAEHAPESLGADKGYHTAEVVGFCRGHGIKPHVATVKGRAVAGLDGRTTRSLGYQTSQRIRKRVEEIFGWCKETGRAGDRLSGTPATAVSPGGVNTRAAAIARPAPAAQSSLPARSRHQAERIRAGSQGFFQGLLEPVMHF